MRSDGHRHGPKRRGFWLMHLPDYLDGNGEIKADPGVDRVFVEFTTAVVAKATRTAAGKQPGRAACPGYGRKVTCSGAIDTSIEQWPRRIEWWCPACGDSGSIFGWEWTRWNRMDLWGSETKVARARVRRKAG